MKTTQARFIAALGSPVRPRRVRQRRSAQRQRRKRWHRGQRGSAGSSGSGGISGTRGRHRGSAGSAAPRGRAAPRARSGTAGSDGGTMPIPPTLGTQIDRFGRPAINTALEPHLRHRLERQGHGQGHVQCRGGSLDVGRVVQERRLPRTSRSSTAWTRTAATGCSPAERRGRLRHAGRGARRRSHDPRHPRPRAATSAWSSAPAPAAGASSTTT